MSRYGDLKLGQVHPQAAALRDAARAVASARGSVGYTNADIHLARKAIDAWLLAMAEPLNDIRLIVEEWEILRVDPDVERTDNDRDAIQAIADRLGVGR